jgi:hypothetical protein
MNHFVKKYGSKFGSMLTDIILSAGIASSRKIIELVQKKTQGRGWLINQNDSRF